MIGIIQFIEDARFIGDTSLSPYQKTFLKTFYGEPLDRREKRIFRECTGIRRYRPRIYNESTLNAGRRSGKTDKILTNLVLYEAFMGRHEEHLSVGETATILLIATSKRQAQIDFNYVRGKIRNSEILEAMVESETKETITLTNRIQISVYPCSEVAPRGLSVCCSGFDEIGHMKHEGVNIDKRVVDSVRPALIQFPNSKLVKSTTPSRKAGVVYEDYKNHLSKDYEVLFLIS